jgi:hypothetical protein
MQALIVDGNVRQTITQMIACRQAISLIKNFDSMIEINLKYEITH